MTSDLQSTKECIVYEKTNVFVNSECSFNSVDCYRPAITPILFGRQFTIKRTIWFIRLVRAVRLWKYFWSVRPVWLRLVRQHGFWHRVWQHGKWKAS